MDIPGRYGSEEIAVLLPQTDINGAYLIGERIRNYFYHNPLNVGHNNVHFTVSIGVTEYIQSSTSPEEIIKMADDALYEAKDKGRNLTVAIPGK